MADVPPCAQTATSGHTLDYLRNADSGDIAQGVRDTSSGSFPFNPTLDGPDGPIDSLTAGTNLDEGGRDSLSYHVFRLVSSNLLEHTSHHKLSIHINSPISSARAALTPC